MLKSWIAASLLVLATIPASAADSTKPVIITSGDLMAGVFNKPGTVTSTEKSDLPTQFQAKDYLPFTSSDEKLFAGVYQTTGHHRYDITEPYGVDEYMHFLKGGVTLTSTDGTVIEVKAGDSVMIPREWTGVWESEGYEKIYVIYDTTEAAED